MELTSDYVEEVLAFLLFLPVFIFCFVSSFCFLDDPCLPLVISDDVSVVVPLQSSNICCGSNYSLVVVLMSSGFICMELWIMVIWNHVYIYIELRAVQLFC
jgi:hypothetical protein